MRSFDLNIDQDEDFNIDVNEDGKLYQLETYPLSRCSQKQVYESLNEVEKVSFAFVNASVGWLGVTASTVCTLL